MQEKYNNLQDYLDFEFTGMKSFFWYEFRTRKACVLASSTMYMPSKDLCDKYKQKIKISSLLKTLNATF